MVLEKRSRQLRKWDMIYDEKWQRKIELETCFRTWMVHSNLDMVEGSDQLLDIWVVDSLSVWLNPALFGPVMRINQ